MDENIKLVRVKKETWDRLGQLKKWEDRMNFNDVIEFLLNEYEENEHTKELLK